MKNPETTIALPFLTHNISAIGGAAYDFKKCNSIIFSFFAAPPRIVLDPPYQIVRQGDSARIICTATGDQPIQIQWAKQA